MKIGIVTFQRADNQGALLQCYALYSYLRKLESEIEVIDYRNINIENVYRIFQLSKNPVIMLNHWKNGIKQYKSLRERHKNFERLRKKIVFSKYLTRKKIKCKKAEYDLIIAGSDQIWNTNITRGFDDIYYLNFPGNYVKASYAASIGSIDNPEFEKDYFKEVLSKFDALSVREKDATEFISKLISKPVTQCIDPVFLLMKSEWESLTKDSDIKLPERYILLYYMEKNPELLEMAEKLSMEKKIPVVCFDKSVVLNCEMVYSTTAGPIEFVKMIRNAETVVTSSFHATAFSCIFGKDIHIMVHSVTGSRVYSLTEMFGIEHRIYSSYTDFENRYNIAEKMEYDYEKYYVQYEKSEQYLKKLLSMAGGQVGE